MMKTLLSDKKMSSAWWRQLIRGVMVSWLQRCVSASVWGSHVDVTYPCHHDFVPSGEHFFVGKTPSLFGYFCY